MSYIEWIAAAADDAHSSQGNIEQGEPQTSDAGGQADLELMEDSRQEESWETERVGKIYRKRTVAMLRRYMRYSIETGRLPSLLGREFFRAKVTAYTVVTFQQPHVEQNLSQRIHGQWSQTPHRLLIAVQQTSRRPSIVFLQDMPGDQLSRKLVQLLQAPLHVMHKDHRLDTIPENSCQGGEERENHVSSCEDGENKF